MPREMREVKQIPQDPRQRHFWSRKTFVEWVNKTLKSNYTNINEFKNGAAFLQLLDLLFPGCVPMDVVKFSADLPFECYQNFMLLKRVFKKLDIQKNFDVNALSTGHHVETWKFLNWFKAFFDENFLELHYDAVTARNGAYMGFGKNRQVRKKRADKQASSRVSSAICLFKGDIKRAYKSDMTVSKGRETPDVSECDTTMPECYCDGNVSLENKSPVEGIVTLSNSFNKNTASMATQTMNMFQTNIDLLKEPPGKVSTGTSMDFNVNAERESTCTLFLLPKHFSISFDNFVDIDVDENFIEKRQRYMTAKLIEDFLNNQRGRRTEYFERFASLIKERYENETVKSIFAKQDSNVKPQPEEAMEPMKVDNENSL